MFRKISRTTSLFLVALATLGGGTALAQSPADEVYNPTSGVLDVVESGTPTPTPTAAPEESGTAPETESAPATTEEETAPAAATATPVATPTAQTQEAASGDLPFTGFEAGFVALAGLALLGGGFAMRRATRNQS